MKTPCKVRSQTFEALLLGMLIPCMVTRKPQGLIILPTLGYKLITRREENHPFPQTHIILHT